MTEEEKQYLLKHGTGHMLPEERKALEKLDDIQYASSAVPKLAKRMLLAAMGEETVKQTIAERLFKEHGSEILNTCPRCEKLARTPLAKQCRYCGLDWH